MTKLSPILLTVMYEHWDVTLNPVKSVSVPCVIGMRGIMILVYAAIDVKSGFTQPVLKYQMKSATSQEEDWFCTQCQVNTANQIRWGDLVGQDNIRITVNKIYDEITTWRKNLFLLPRGKAGTEFIKELTRLIELFVNETKWKNLSLTLMHIFIPIMLQKPSPKSKAKQHVKYLMKRLQLWKSGDLNTLMNEVNVTQKRLKTSAKIRKSPKRKLFADKCCWAKLVRR